MEHSKQLESNSLGLVESSVMGVAGTAPAYSLTATTGVLLLAVALSSMGILLYSGLILFGITLSFFHLNKVYTSAGGPYYWVGKVFNPFLGFAAGWALLVSAVIFMVSGTIPAAVATLSLFFPQTVQNPSIVAATAAFWLLIVSLIVMKGIKLSSYFQMILTFFDVGLLIIIIGGALYFSYSNPIVPFNMEQFSPFNFSLMEFARGSLICLFLFWGWDVTVNLSEETKNGEKSASLASAIAMGFVLLVFLAFVLGVQWSLNNVEIKNAGTNLLFELAEKTFSRPWSYMAVIAVMVSTVGTLETTILQFTRTLFAVGRDGVLHTKYAKLHPTWKTPLNATIVISSIGFFLLFLSSFFESVDDVIATSIDAIGFLVAFYYGLTAFACVWYFRKEIKNGFVKSVLFVFWPLISALLMVLIVGYSLHSFNWKVSALGMGGLFIGMIPFFYNKCKN